MPAERQKTAGQRLARERYDADVREVGFLVNRHRPVGWSIQKLANSRHDILVLALDGRARYECEGARFEVGRGTMLLFPRGLEHSASSDPRSPWSFYSLGLELRPRTAGAAEAFAGLPRHQAMGNFPQIAEWFAQLQRHWTGREPGRRMACRALAGLLIQQYVLAAEAGRRSVPHAARLEALIDRMHREEGRVRPVGELADEAGLSESRFRQLFRELTGCSVTRYQNRLRIQAARDLLATGHYGVGEVALELGFRDIYYFSRLFKRITGLSPSACRPD